MNIATRPLRIPDSKLAREVTEIVRDTEPELLFNHSSRVYLFGALTGEHHGLKFDAELLYAANQRLRRAIMDENGGGAGRLVGASRRAIVLRLTSLRWLATPISSPARAA